MIISSPQYGAEMITHKGRVLKYDALECLIYHLEKEDIPFNALYAVPYDAPKKLFPIDSLKFIISPQYKSPMGANLAGFIDPVSINKEQQDLLVNWDSVKNRLLK